MDVWFSGYNQRTVTTVWVGFDDYTPLGRREFGGTAALPIWIEYMQAALKNSPQLERPVPAGVVTVKIDPDSGLLAAPGQRNAIFEYFLQGSVPQRNGREQIHSSGNDSGVSDQINDIF
jgi:penicillin-binding protein 1A